MKNSERVRALLFANVAILVSLLGAWSRSLPKDPVPELRPRVGRTLSEQTSDPEGAFRTAPRWSSLLEAARVLAQRREILGKELDPELARGNFSRVIVHAFAGPAPNLDSEEGPPWHLILADDGRVQVTARGKAGRRGLVLGVEPSISRSAIHLLVQEAKEINSGRRDRLVAVVDWLCARVGAKAAEVREEPGVDPSLAPTLGALH